MVSIKAIFNCTGSLMLSLTYPVGFLPLVCVPSNMPTWSPISRRQSILALMLLLSATASLVRSPCFNCACLMRSIPSAVLGPVDLPPCVLHTCFPLRAGAAHCSFVRFDLAWQRGHETRPPRVMRVCSKFKVGLDMIYTLCRGSRG